MFRELYTYTNNYLYYLVKKERSLRTLEKDLEKMQNELRSIVTSRAAAHKVDDQDEEDGKKNPPTAPTYAWGLGATTDKVEEEELAVVMTDETYLVKVRTALKTNE